MHVVNIALANIFETTLKDSIWIGFDINFTILAQSFLSI